MLDEESHAVPRSYTPDIEEFIGDSGFRFRVSRAQSEKHKPKSHEFSWSELADLLTSYRIGRKSGPCILPATFKGDERKANNAVRCDILMLDIDGGSSFDEIREALKRAGLAGVIASTYSHTPENPKFRITLPLAKPWMVSDYPNIPAALSAWKTMIRAVAAHLGIKHDSQCEDVSRLFFLPRYPSGTTPQSVVIGGEWCDPRTIPPSSVGRTAPSASVPSEPQGQMSAEERLNNLALRHIADWAPKLYPEGRWSDQAWRVRSADLGRNFEEDLSIDPNGIRDFGPEQNFTAIKLIQRDFRITAGEPERIEHEDWTEAGRTLLGANFEDAATWLAEQLGESWRAMGQTWIASVFDDLGEEDPPESQTPENRKTGLRFLGAAELRSLPQPLDFVEGVLFDAQLAVVYGEPGSGKSTFVLDIAMHAACGRPWNRRQVERGGFLFLALEGMFGIRDRFLAWCRHHEVEADSAPAKFADGTLDIRNDKAARKEMVRVCKGMAQQWDVPVRLIVIDTLARAMAGGDENSSQDMGQVIAAADALRQATGALVIVIHHSGKDASKGARGHSSLRGAVDTEIEVKGSGVSRIATVTKQKDAPCEGEWRFRLESVPTGETDRRGKPITGAVVISGPQFEDLSDEPDVSQRSRDALAILVKVLAAKGRPAAEIPEIAKNPDLLVHVDSDKIACPVRDWRTSLEEAGWGAWKKADNDQDEKADNSGSAERAFGRAKKDLRDSGLIRFGGPKSKFVWLTGQTAGQRFG